MELTVDNQNTLRQLTREDALDIFNTIDSQREYLGKWLPFVEHTISVADPLAFIDSVVEAPEDKFNYTFTIQIDGRFGGIIGFKDTGFQKNIRAEE